MAGSWKKWILDLLFPPKCIFCGDLAEDMICTKCAAGLPETGDSARQEVESGLLCVSPLYYEGAVRESLLRFKFEDCRHYAKGYAPLLARAAALEFGGEFDLVSWVPVSEKRRRERGYDQAELLARELCLLWETAPVRTLCKTVHTAAQSGITAAEERHANVLGVYEAANREQWEGKRILLVDDILTTGATVAEAARTLRFAGAKEVLVLTAARGRDGKTKNVMETKP